MDTTMARADFFRCFFLWSIALTLPLTLWTRTDARENCSLRVGWEPYGVYSYQDEKGNPTGVDLELMQMLGKEIGCRIIFKQIPWSRHLLELEAGLVDVATSVRKSTERETYGWFSEPYRKTEIALYVRRGESQNYHLPQLAAIGKVDFRLGIVDGYYYGSAFAELMKDPLFAQHIEKVLDYASTLRMLIYGRLDGVLAEDVSVLIHQAKTLGLYEQIEAYPLTIPGDQFYLLFSKKSVDPALVADVNATLARMKADGRLQQLLDKYLKNL